MTIEKPKLALQLELSIPDLEGGPAKKFLVSRTLRAKWSTSPGEVITSVLEEVKSYKGSFVGDMIVSLVGLVKNRDVVNDEKNVRSLEVDRWLASLLTELIYSGIREEIYVEKTESFELDEWDGTVKKIDPLTPADVASADVERILAMITPKIKHALELFGKKL